MISPPLSPAQLVAEGGPGGPFDTVAGLPVHPLVVHAAVVLLPLSAIGLVAIVLVPRWRAPLGWLVMGGLLVATGASFVAKESGEKLAARVGEPTLHAELGDQLPIIAAALLAIGGVWFLLARRADRAGTKSSLTTVIGVVAILVAALNLVWVVRVGHSGAEAVWADQIKATDSADPGGATGTYTLAEVQAHATPGDCWMAVNGTVYDVTAYEGAHPGGAAHITDLCGTDGTASYTGQHGGDSRPASILAGYAIGTLSSGSTPSRPPSPSASPLPPTNTFTMAQVLSHDMVDDCWAVIDGKVYDVSGYSSSHPGGATHIDRMCGTVATDYFRGEHQGDKRPNEILAGFQIGTLG